ncbi:MAG: hypothetical protein JRN68_06085 [Nitrososphaerota archaeon]|nr:hypothetical protein [Ferrimicrobium acidiphilum]MDG6934249.1 hypothetical protein [Nitrososphaerota archaeon]
MRTIVGHQGDVVVERISAVPANARKSESKRLSLHSESGNNHVLDASAIFNADSEESFVVVDEPTQMTHPQHPTLNLAEGIYSVRHVRDYTPRRNMLD